MRSLALSFAVVLGITGCGSATRSSSEPGLPEQRTSSVTDRDNTGVNQRDRDTNTKTPTDQNENKADIKTTADIRKAIVDSDLSVNARNVKIITQDGRVTLRGPVKSVDEKQRVEKIASGIAGAGKVESQLEVEQSP